MFKRVTVALAGMAVVVGALAVQCAGRPAIGFVAPRIVAELPDPNSTLRKVHGDAWYVSNQVSAGAPHRLGVVVENPGEVPITLRNVRLGSDAHYLYDFAPALVGASKPPFTFEGAVARSTVTLAPGEKRVFVLPSVYKCTIPQELQPLSFSALVEVHADVRFRNANRHVRMRLPVPDGVTPSSCQP